MRTAQAKHEHGTSRDVKRALREEAVKRGRAVHSSHRQNKKNGKSGPTAGRRADLQLVTEKGGLQL